MKARTRKRVQSELQQLEAAIGRGGAMLVVPATRLILARSSGAPKAQGRADGLARGALSLTSDPIMSALFRRAKTTGRLALARKLTGGEGATGLMQSPGCEEAIVLDSETTPDAERLIGGAEKLFELLGLEEAAAS